jgi:hypothetical protein
VAPFSVPGLRRTRKLAEHEQYHHDHDNNRGRADHHAPIATTPGHPIANAAAPSALVATFCACDASTRGRVWTASVISIQQADLQFGVPGLASPGLASKIAYSLARRIIARSSTARRMTSVSGSELSAGQIQSRSSASRHYHPCHNHQTHCI